MKCHVNNCLSLNATVCDACYRRVLSRYEDLLAEKTNMVRECHELQAENTMLKLKLLQMADRQIPS